MDIVEVLDFIAQVNINSCACTTYDMGIIECARRHIIASLAEQYDVKYTIKTTETRDFPVGRMRGA